MRRALALATAGLALAAAPAGAREHVVNMPGKFFTPPATTLLVGDTVTWKNSDATGHDVAALGGAFGSGLMGPGARFSVAFQHSGHIAYRCTIHPFMAGTLDVYAFQLRGPNGAVAAGRPAVLQGQAPGGVPAVTIEQRQADGTWAPVVTVPVGRDGSFHARLVPRRPGVYRAISAGNPSLPLALPVGAQLQTAVRRLKGGRVAIRAVARPAQAGALAALQLYSRERYRWRQVAHTRVDRRSRATFVVSPPGRYAARVVLLKGRGGYGASVGPVRHIGPPGSGSRPHRMPPHRTPHPHHH